MVTGMHLFLKKNRPMIQPLWFLVVKLRMIWSMAMRLVPKGNDTLQVFSCLSTFTCYELLSIIFQKSGLGPLYLIQLEFYIFMCLLPVLVINIVVIA